jgi:hypothetical protein
MDIQVGSVVMPKPSMWACLRTKNMIREHGVKGFEIVRFDPKSWLFGGEPAVMLESVAFTLASNSGERIPWRGWIPLGEIKD